MIDNYSNRLFTGIHATTRNSHSNSPYTLYKESNSLFRDNNHDHENKLPVDSNANNNLKLINNVRSKYGNGNFASVFGNKLESFGNPLNLLTSDCTVGNDSNNVDLILDDSITSVFKNHTIDYDDYGLLKLEDSYQYPLKKLHNRTFEDCVYVDLTDSDPDTDDNVNSGDNASDCSTSSGNGKGYDKYNKLGYKDEKYNKYGYKDDNYEHLNSATHQFDTFLKEFTKPVKKVNDKSTDKLLKLLHERDEEIVQLREECAQLNNHLKSIPSRESLVEKLRSEVLSALSLKYAEITTLKSENQSLKLRLVDMEALQFEKDGKIQQLIFERNRNEEEISKLNRNIKLVELNLESEKTEKMELSLESVKNQKEERLRGRLEWSKKLELEKFDKIQIEKVSTDRLYKIRGLEKSMKELEKALKSSLDNEKGLKRIIRDLEEKVEKYKDEIVELKSLLLVSKSQKSLINTYQSKLDDLTCQLDNEKLINQKDKVMNTITNENMRDFKKLDQSFQRKIDAIVDKIRSKGKAIQVDWICDDMFKVQGRIVQVKLIGGKVCALKNGTPFPLELLLLN